MNTKAVLIVLTVLSLLPKFGFAENLDRPVTASKQPIRQRLMTASQIQASKLERTSLASSFKKAPLEVMIKGGAGIDGGGSDGLDMENAKRINGDLTVPIPDSMLNKYGYLRVDGEYGKNQQETLHVYKCKTNAKGELVRFGCGDGPEFAGLNKSIKLSVGTYYVSVSATTSQLVRITEGNTVVLPLVKIQIPQTNEPINFNVFWDFRSEKMRDLYLIESYTVHFPKGAYDDICINGMNKKFPPMTAWCGVPMEGAYRRLLGTLHKFNADGTQNYLVQDNRWEALGRVYAAQLSSPDFISVLPGVYGIEFTNRQTGEFRSQYGIVAE